MEKYMLYGIYGSQNENSSFIVVSIVVKKFLAVYSIFQDSSLLSG